MSGQRVPPPYVPTLTEVVGHPSPPMAAPVAFSTGPDRLEVAALVDQVVATMMPRLVETLEERMRERLFQWADDQAGLLVQEATVALQAGLAPVVQAAIREALQDPASWP